MRMDTEPIETNNTEQDEMNNTFEANGKTWATDSKTLELMREYREAGNKEMVATVFELGKAFGKIVPA